MKKEIINASWQIDGIWARVSARKATVSWGRSRTREVIKNMLLNSNYITDQQKEKIDKDCGFGLTKKIKRNATINIVTDIIGLPKETNKRVDVSNFNIGDYVFLSKYSDADPNDPWHVGFIDEIGCDAKGGFIRCNESSRKYWRNAIKIDRSTGERILRTFRDQKMTLPDAIGVLERHNQWRRDSNVPANQKMIDPKTVGLAIDVVVKELKKVVT